MSGGRVAVILVAWVLLAATLAAQEPPPRILLDRHPERLDQGAIDHAVLVHRQQPGAAHLPRALHAAIQCVPHAPVLPQALNRNTQLPSQRVEYTERLGAGAVVHDVNVPDLSPQRINGLPDSMVEPPASVMKRIERDNHLIGVVSQADVALTAKEKTTGEVVESISQAPAGPRVQSSTDREPQAKQRY